jgi:hypothetical protein
MPIPPRAGGDRLNLLFPVKADPPPPRTFELGLVLGGTVSVGAYTAGALDFLIEALEAWHADPNAPHRVVIKTAGGSSGGAVCSSILGLLSSRPVPHVTADASPSGTMQVATGNPLWDLWINDFQIDSLLSTGDIDANQNADAGSGAISATVQHVAALLNCQMIDTAAQSLAQLGGKPGQTLPYFAAPFRVAVTVANLRGIPYRIADVPALGAGSGSAAFTGTAYVQHDDFAWFAFPNGARPEVTPTSIGKREDEFWLDATALPSAARTGIVGYDMLAAFGTVSGAMPVGLAARALTRPAEHYHYRPLVRAVADEPLGYRVDWPDPDWSGLPDTASGMYAFTAVDGGTFNNDPVALVHRGLCGLVGQNPRGKSDANRAIFMIDPLADAPQPIQPVGKSLLAVAATMVGTFVGASRYLTADMELFADNDVFSRFQLVPFRPASAGRGGGRVGETALAGSSLYALAGWCAREFRVHDFLLGRANMQAYLRQELILAGDNPLFSGWSPARREDWAVDASGNRVAITGATAPSAYFLPVIPDTTGAPLPVPDWPVGAYDPSTLAKQLEHRLQTVIDKLVSDNGHGPLPWLIDTFAVPGVVSLVASKVVAGFTAELTAAGLWPRAG